MKVLVPKASSEQGRWQKQLGERAQAVRWIDPWKITVFDEAPKIKTEWMNIDAYQGVVIVSPTAAKQLIDALDVYWPMPPVNIHWLCNGPRTASVLQQAGIPVVFPKTGYTSEDILAMPQTQVSPYDKWLIVKGEGGRVTLRETFTERGAHVTELEVYQREIDQDRIFECADMASSIDAIWLSSEFLGKALLSQNKAAWAKWTGQWWVSSERLKHWALAQGLTNVVQTGGATVEDLHEMINTNIV